MAEQVKRLLALVAQNLPKMSPKVMKAWIDNPEELEKFLAGLKQAPAVKKEMDSHEAMNNWARQRSVQGYD